MKPKEGVVDMLNQQLTIELTAINQYFLAAEMCANWGFNRLKERFRSLSLDEMKDAEELIAHTLYLDGLPNLQRLNQVKVGQNVPEVLQAGPIRSGARSTSCEARSITAPESAITPPARCSRR